MNSSLLFAAFCAVGCLAVGRAEPPIEAIAQARHDLDLGFTLKGRVSEVLVEPGSAVEAGQLLVRLDDREGAEQIRLFELRAASHLEIDAAEAQWRLAENEAKRLEEAMASAGAAPFEVERARLEARRSFLAYELFKQRQTETQIQLSQSRLLHEKFEMRAPMAGTIERVIVEPGEMVEEVRPVLRLVVTDPLRIEAPTPMSLARGVSRGQAAWVRFRASGNVLEGRVVSIGNVADPGSETRLVVIDAPNPVGEPAGAHVMVSFERPTDQDSPAR
ncbi:MAG: efflux RND transporter periplasmic adaptor subunit [Phycisphaerae bacterium]|nr:efflux RND transporter periplasmic adaptor subunit [Phycisphaerae bacterium]